MAIQTRSDVWSNSDISSEAKIYLDLSFQSPLRWLPPKMEKYLQCTLDGYATNPIVLADVDSCLNAAKRTGDKTTIKYFSDLKKDGWDYVIIDGNNRMNALRYFFENMVGMPKGDYINIMSKTVMTIARKNQRTVLWGELQPQQRQYFGLFPLNVTIVEEITRKELSEYFDAVNEGVKLNHQEIINSWYSRMAEQVRMWGEDYFNVFDKKVSGGSFRVKRRDHDELIAHWAVSCQSEQFSTNITKSMVADAYGNNIEYSTDASNHPERWEPILKKTLAVVRNFDDRSISKSTLLDIANFLRQHMDKNIEDKLFSDYMREVVHQLQKDPEVIHKDKKTGNQFTYSGMLRDSYKSSYMRIRLHRMTHWFFNHDPKLAESLLPVSNPEGRKEKRIFTPLQRYDIWKKQGKKDINDVPIPLEELNDSSRWQADHILEYNEGGKTEVENGQLMSVVEHQAKTARYNRELYVQKVEAKRQQLAAL